MLTVDDIMRIGKIENSYRVPRLSIIEDFDSWWHETRMKHDPHYRKKVQEKAAQTWSRIMLDLDIMFGSHTFGF